MRSLNKFLCIAACQLICMSMNTQTLYVDLLSGGTLDVGVGAVLDVPGSINVDNYSLGGMNSELFIDGELNLLNSLYCYGTLDGDGKLRLYGGATCNLNIGVGEIGTLILDKANLSLKTTLESNFRITNRFTLTKGYLWLDEYDLILETADLDFIDGKNGYVITGSSLSDGGVYVNETSMSHNGKMIYEGKPPILPTIAYPVGGEGPGCTQPSLSDYIMFPIGGNTYSPLFLKYDGYNVNAPGAEWFPDDSRIACFVGEGFENEVNTLVETGTLLLDDLNAIDLGAPSCPQNLAYPGSGAISRWWFLKSQNLKLSSEEPITFVECGGLFQFWDDNCDDDLMSNDLNYNIGAPQITSEAYEVIMYLDPYDFGANDPELGLSAVTRNLGLELDEFWDDDFAMYPPYCDLDYFSDLSYEDNAAYVRDPANYLTNEMPGIMSDNALYADAIGSTWNYAIQDIANPVNPQDPPLEQGCDDPALITPHPYIHGTGITDGHVVFSAIEGCGLDPNLTILNDYAASCEDETATDPYEVDLHIALYENFSPNHVLGHKLTFLPASTDPIANIEQFFSLEDFSGSFSSHHVEFLDVGVAGNQVVDIDLATTLYEIVEISQTDCNSPDYSWASNVELLGTGVYVGRCLSKLCGGSSVAQLLDGEEVECGTEYLPTYYWTFESLSLEEADLASGCTSIAEAHPSSDLNSSCWDQADSRLQDLILGTYCTPINHVMTDSDDNVCDDANDLVLGNYFDLHAAGNGLGASYARLRRDDPSSLGNINELVFNYNPTTGENASCTGPTINNGIGKRISVEFFVRFGDSESGSYEIWSNGQGNQPIEFRMFGGTLRSVFKYYHDGGSDIVSVNIPMDGIDRNSLDYYLDGNWHHFALTLDLSFSNGYGQAQLYADGYSPQGFSKIFSLAGANAEFAHGDAMTSRSFVADPCDALDPSTVAIVDHFPGDFDIDEVAIYVGQILPANLIYEHAQLINNSSPIHYQVAAQGDLCSLPPVPNVNGVEDPLQYVPGYEFAEQTPYMPNRYNSTDLPHTQISQAALPRYLPDVDIHENIVWWPYYILGGATSATGSNPVTFDWGQVNPSSTAEVTSAFQASLTSNWNYMATIWGMNGIETLVQSSINILPSDVKLSYNTDLQNAKWDEGYTSFTTAQDHPNILRTDLQDPALLWNCATADPAWVDCTDSGPYYFNSTPNAQFPAETWSLGAADLWPARLDGWIQANYIEDQLPANWLKKIDYISENDEIGPVFKYGFSQSDSEGITMDQMEIFGSNNQISTDPDFPALPLDQASWANYQSHEKDDLRATYMSELGLQLIALGLTDTEFESSYYAVDGMGGHAALPNTWTGLRGAVTNTINNIENSYSTTDFYPRGANSWAGLGGGRFGMTRMKQTRPIEILADPDHSQFCSPFVSAGWDPQPETNIRPGQYLGLMKALALHGSEYFHAGYFHAEYDVASGPESDNGLQHGLGDGAKDQWDAADPRGWCWQPLIPSYAQALMTRLGSDFANSQILVDASNNVYMEWEDGEPDVYTAGRVIYNDDESATIKGYIFTSTLQPFSNVIQTGDDGSEINDEAYERGCDVNIPNGTGGTLTTITGITARRQGSTYAYYPADGAIDPLFYQLDGWHEASHPSWWSDNFDFEAELFDVQSGDTPIKTESVDGLQNVVTYDESLGNFTSYVDFGASGGSIEFFFTPTGSYTNSNLSARNYRVMIRARNPDASPSTQAVLSISVTPDGGQAGTPFTVPVCGQDWKWFVECDCDAFVNFLNLSVGTEYKLTVSSNQSLEIDRIILDEYDPVTNPGIWDPSAVITPLDWDLATMLNGTSYDDDPFVEDQITFTDASASTYDCYMPDLRLDPAQFVFSAPACPIGGGAPPPSFSVSNTCQSLGVKMAVTSSTINPACGLDTKVQWYVIEDGEKTILMEGLPDETIAFEKSNGMSWEGAQKNPTFKAEVGDYIIGLTLTLDGEPQSVEKQITIFADPVIEPFEAMDLCPSEEVLIEPEVLTDGNVDYTYRWFPEVGLTTNEGNTANTADENTTTVRSTEYVHKRGTNDFVYYVEDENGCKSQDTLFITYTKPDFELEGMFTDFDCGQVEIDAADLQQSYDIQIEIDGISHSEFGDCGDDDFWQVQWWPSSLVDDPCSPATTVYLYPESAALNVQVQVTSPRGCAAKNTLTLTGLEEGEPAGSLCAREQMLEVLGVGTSFSLAVVPNPNLGVFNLNILNNVDDQPLYFTVLNGISETVVDRTFLESTTVNINMQNHAAGMYYVKVDNGQEYKVVKVIIQN
jgi:hypothetical protein